VCVCSEEGEGEEVRLREHTTRNERKESEQCLPMMTIALSL